jgi:nucleoside-diphosphate-sugar epimerase
MKIVVIGGSGLIGKKLVTKLHERGHRRFADGGLRRFSSTVFDRPFEILSGCGQRPVLETQTPGTLVS